MGRGGGMVEDLEAQQALATHEQQEELFPGQGLAVMKRPEKEALDDDCEEPSKIPRIPLRFRLLLIQNLQGDAFYQWDSLLDTSYF